MPKIGQTVIVDNPNMSNDSPNPSIASQGERIINRIGIILKNKHWGKFIVLIGKHTFLLHELEFSVLNNKSYSYKNGS